MSSDTLLLEEQIESLITFDIFSITTIAMAIKNNHTKGLI